MVGGLEECEFWETEPVLPMRQALQVYGSGKVSWPVEHGRMGSLPLIRYLYRCETR